MVKIGKEKENKSKNKNKNKNKQTNKHKRQGRKGYRIIQEEDNVMIIVKKKFKNSWSAGKLKNR